MKSSMILFSGTLLATSLVYADQARWTQKSFPFKQSLNMEMVYDITNSKPEELINKINKLGVKVLVVKTENPTKALNPLLKNLEIASDELLKKAEVQQTYEGRMIGKSNPCCDLKQDTILIRDTALTYTLIHEFMHANLVAETATGDQDLETQFTSNFRRLTFYQQRIFNNSYELLSPLWRRDMLSAQADVVDKLFARLQMGQSQEAIIEKVLESYIDSKNQFYDKARQEQGLKYGGFMIDNAIDIFNAADASIRFCQATVANIRESIVNGQINKSEEPKLNQAAAKAYDKAAKDLLARLETVKVQILLLKEMYSK